MNAAGVGQQLRVEGFREQFSDPEAAAAWLQSWLKVRQIGRDELVDVFHTAMPLPNRQR